MQMTNKNIIKTVFFISLAAGLAAGVIYGWMFTSEHLYVQFPWTSASVLPNIFFESLFKYSKYFIILWILAFLPAWLPVSFFVMFLRSFGVGFAGFFLFFNHGFFAVVYSFLLIIPQNAVFFLTAFFLLRVSYIFSGKLRKYNFFAVNGFAGYLFALLISIVAASLISALDAFVLPLCFSFFA